MISSALLPLLVATIGPSDSPPKVQPLDPAPTVQEADKAWSGSVTAGAIITTGNSETKSATLSGEAVWKGDPDRFTVGALWNYQGDRTGVIQRKVYGSAQYDHFLNEKTYSYAKATGEHDFNAALDLRWTAGVGLGHQFREDEEWDVSGEAGVSYVDEEYGPTPANLLGSTNEYMAARVAGQIAYLGSDKWEFTHGGEIYPSLEDKDDVYARWDTKVKTQLTESMFAQLQWIWDYDNTPAAGKGRNDSLFALTVGWSF